MMCDNGECDYGEAEPQYIGDDIHPTFWWRRCSRCTTSLMVFVCPCCHFEPRGSSLMQRLKWWLVDQIYWNRRYYND